MKYDPTLRGELDDLFDADPDVKPGQMFGLPGYYTDGKLFVCLYDAGALVRLPQDEVADLIAAGDAEPFVMKGRAAKGWVVLPGVVPQVILRAKEYAASLPKKPPRKRKPK